MDNYLKDKVGVSLLYLGRREITSFVFGKDGIIDTKDVIMKRVELKNCCENSAKDFERDIVPLLKNNIQAAQQQQSWL